MHYIKKNPRNRLYQYPIRTCLSMHHCESCGGTISYGQKYYDGGYGRRTHVECPKKTSV